jgi:hypothetical protein
MLVFGIVSNDFARLLLTNHYGLENMLTSPPDLWPLDYLTPQTFETGYCTT